MANLSSSDRTMPVLNGNCRLLPLNSFKLSKNMSGSQESSDMQLEDGEENQEMEEVAGEYQKHSIINCRIVAYHGLNRFCIWSKVLNHEQFTKMKTVLDLKFNSGSLMYSARPYTTNIGDIKLFIYDGSVSRCLIEDMYTKNCGGQIHVYAEVSAIDYDQRKVHVPISKLYDLPRFIEHYKDVEHQAKRARLYLGKYFNETLEDEIIDRYFRDKIRTCYNNFKVKIMDFTNGIYTVDIYDFRGNSLSQHILKKFQDKIYSLERSDSNGGSETSGYASDKQKCCDYQTVRDVNRRIDSFHTIKYPILPKIKQKAYDGAAHYFKCKFDENLGNKESSLSKEFFKVRVLNWCDPDSFYIIPNDPAYLDSYEIFKKQIDIYQQVVDQDESLTPFHLRLYRVGQICLFKNEIDVHLGTWLRGVIVKVPLRTKNGHLKDAIVVGDHIESSYFNPNDISLYVYHVRSIDYGFQCVRSPINLRPVKNESLFSKKGPWAVKCKLFGVYPFRHNRDEEAIFSDVCLSRIDMWMREKILDTGPSAFFYILSRSELLRLPTKWIDDKPVFDITLFHRYEPPYRLEDCIMPRKRRSRFDCLNSELIDLGLADSHENDQDISSNVDLDHYVVNLLVTHDRI